MEILCFFFNFDEDVRINNFIELIFIGKDVIFCLFFVFKNNEVGFFLVVYYLGLKFVGYWGIVYGGMSVFLLDDCMGRVCFFWFVGKVGVIVSLDLIYKSFIFVDSFILICVDIKMVEGCKVWVDVFVVDV